MKKWAVSAGVLVILLISFYFIANMVIRRKVDAALRALPSAMKVEYRDLRANVLTGSLSLVGVHARYIPAAGHMHEVTVEKIEVRGLSVLAWVRSHRLRIRDIRVDSVLIRVDEDLLKEDSGLRSLQPPAVDALIGQVDLTRLTIEGMRKGKSSFSASGELHLDSVTRDSVSAVRLLMDSARYIVPGMEETVHLSRFEMDSRKRSLTIDTFRITPNLDKVEIGRLKGHQVDVVRAVANAISVEGLDVMALRKQRLRADRINIGGTRVVVFRDRRLPLESGDKAMPMEALANMPGDVRVGKVRLGKTRFEYEEFPKVGDKSGKLVIDNFTGTMEPLLNKQRPGDPAFITVTTEGSLMGSGLVKATTRMPFHKDAFYEVAGVFHNLDVTKLNNPAENLGQLHLESGMLNSLEFQFEMGAERSSGKIVGEYHDLVVDKLKEKDGQLKTDKVKSFALKKLIIPKDKDKSLPLSKRTGKVNYKRDRERYFSYYLLHSLLVGVKSSFSLGFLLPG